MCGTNGGGGGASVSGFKKRGDRIISLPYHFRFNLWMYSMAVVNHSAARFVLAREVRPDNQMINLSFRLPSTTPSFRFFIVSKLQTYGQTQELSQGAKKEQQNERKRTNKQPQNGGKNERTNSKRSKEWV